MMPNDPFSTAVLQAKPADLQRFAERLWDSVVGSEKPEPTIVFVHPDQGFHLLSGLADGQGGLEQALASLNADQLQKFSFYLFEDTQLYFGARGDRNKVATTLIKAARKERKE